MSILVVEENKMLRNFFEKLFDYWQVESILIKDYAEAMTFAERSGHARCTHFLLEIQSIAASREVLKSLRRNNPEAKAIALCNDSFQKTVNDFKRDSFAEVLVKPFRVEELKKALNV